MSPTQVKMARAALDWSSRDLARTSGVHHNTISNFEIGKYAGKPATMKKLRKALEKAGVEFINSNGVRLKKT